MVLRPVHLTIFGCLFWALGLLSSVYAVCEYWGLHQTVLYPQYCMWYQSRFGWVQLVLGLSCLLASIFTGKQLFGIFLFLMASHGIVFGLWQAPIPSRADTLQGLSVNSIARYLKSSAESGGSSNSPSLFVQMRKCMVERHEQSLGKTNGALLASIVLGDKVVNLPSKVKKDFRRSGVSHLLAASGFNLSIFVTATCLCLRLITRYNTFIAFAGILSVLGFVLLAGPSPSVVRATIWAMLLLLLKLTDRRINLFALLSFSLFLHLVIDPFSILDIGWQLSYAATASILCGVKNIEECHLEKDFSITEFILKWFRSVVAVVLMAQAAVLPLACLYFKQINALFLPVNLLLDPLIAPLTILGFVSSWFSLWCPGVAWCLDKLALFPLEYMLWVTSFFSRLEFSQINIKPPPTLIFVEYCAALVYFVFAKQSQSKLKRNFRFASIVFYLSLLLLLLSSICP